MGKQEHPLIEIGIEIKGEDKVFFVRDNGSGIEQKYQQKVFGLFERLDSRNEGTGVGLTLVKKIVDLYGGQIWLESEGTGKGSTFFFTLPKAIKGGKGDETQ